MILMGLNESGSGGSEVIFMLLLFRRESNRKLCRGYIMEFVVQICLPVRRVDFEKAAQVEPGRESQVCLQHFVARRLSEGA